MTTLQNYFQIEFVRRHKSQTNQYAVRPNTKIKQDAALWVWTNGCRHFRDYYYPDDNENCYYDPDTTLSIPQLIEKYAGKVELHNVTTEDGYIITMFRIPNGNRKGVILLHHSIATHSHIYLWQGNNSLALTLWRDGFDVWLANQRGTIFSDKHVNMTKYDFAYWDFSVHEMGLYDVTSELELIQSKTNGSQVIFFGHSLGSAIGLIYSALKPIQASKYLKTMILLATPAYFEHGTSLVFLFIRLSSYIKAFMDLIHLGSPLILLPFIIPVSRVFLRLFPFILFVVNVFVWQCCGYTPSETDPTFFNYDGAIYADNFSWKTLAHFGQLANARNRFQMYDYGEKENLKIYGQKIPPLYPLQNITVPTLLVSSYNDTLVSLKDCENLYQQLSPKAKVHGHWKISGLNHLDYHLGLHRKEIFVHELLEFLNNLK
ncbi:lipase member J-like isoform X2 [Zophobas morio]|uniref:lipase member J-like isoform X2 n=1 Tax=Zophobas morio TaxID=2755281 RepID=UPI003082BEDB